MTKPTIKSFNKRLEALKSERSSFIPLYRELSDYHLAHRGRFLISDRNKGHKRNTKQYNNTSRLASRTLASGMMSGITSPARPWFRLSSGDRGLDDNTAVKAWLFKVQQLMYRIFSSSNAYNALHTLYAELGVFGTSAMGVYHDFDNVIWCKPYTVGSYMIGLNGQNVADTFYREYEISAGQCIKQFGEDNVSKSVRDQWEKGNTEAWVQLVHAVEPNDNRDNISPMAKDKRVRSVYYEKSASTRDGSEKFLKESGFDDFPVMIPRWDVTGEDIYATDCPGITALGDTKALQLGEKRMYQAVDKVSNPPLQAHTSMKNKINNAVLKGNEIAWNDQDNNGVTSIYGNYRPDIGAIQLVNDRAEKRINEGFYKDLFLMLASTDRKQITAREVAEKHEEKLLMLGPVLERLHSELLDPLIDRTFNIALAAGIVPPAPEALQGKELDIQYVSVLAQAQKLINTGGLDRLAGYIGNIASIWPEARHKFNAVQSVDEYSDALGNDPAVINSDEEVAQRVQADNEAAAQAQAAQAADQVAGTAKTASEAEVNENNALGAIMQQAGLG